MSDRRWPDEVTMYHCKHDGNETPGRCVIAGRPWLNEPDKPSGCECPATAIYRREAFTDE